MKLFGCGKLILAAGACALVLSSASFAAERKVLDVPVFSVSSDHESYTVGQTAVLSALISTKPENADYEFDILGELDEAPLAITRSTDYDFSSSAPSLTLGSHTWATTLVLQDKRYARDLKASVIFYDGEISTYETLLGGTSDPNEIAEYEQKIAHYESLKSAANAELAANRTVVETHTLSFNVL